MQSPKQKQPPAKEMFNPGSFIKGLQTKGVKVLSQENSVAQVRLEKAEIDALLKRVRQSKHISFVRDPTIKFDPRLPRVVSQAPISKQPDGADYLF